MVRVAARKAINNRESYRYFRSSSQERTKKTAPTKHSKGSYYSLVVKWAALQDAQGTVLA